MKNHEHPNPREAPEESISSRNTEQIEALTTEHGESFKLYREHSDPTIDIDDLRTTYLMNYRGRHADFEAFIRDEVSMFGIEAVNTAHGTDLRFDSNADYPVIAEALRSHYDTIAHEDHVYVYKSPGATGRHIEAPAEREELIPTTRREIRTLERLHEDFPDAFEVYLKQIWKQTPIGEMESEFLDFYQGTYDYPEEFIKAFLKAMDWSPVIDQAMVSVINYL